MNVILLNESEGKAWIKSRRILSRYFPQLGSRTWAGQISTDGLQVLYQQLKKTASKSTSVACHQILTRSRMELCWTVGTTACFNEDGRYSFRQTAAKRVVSLPPPKSSLEAYAIALVRLAGLMHDLGKSSVAFQAKLKRGHGAETLRHEMISFLIVAESLAVGSTSEVEWLTTLFHTPSRAAACATADSLVPTHSTWLNRCMVRLQADSAPFVQQSELQDMLSRAPGLATMLWLVLTHHRLPLSSHDAQHLDAGRHINRPTTTGSHYISPLTECLLPHSGQKPWEDDRWCAAVSAAAQAALSAREALYAAGPLEIAPTFWVQLSAHLLRPALVLSDHIGSIQAEKGLSVKKAFTSSAAAHANLFDDKHAGDTLSKHLTRVAKLCRQTTSLALHPRELKTTALPPASPARQSGLPERFRWQEDLASACESAQQQGPVFACIIAETGAGKTLGGIRTMHALSKGNLRFTLALGLRSLTWQSAQAMLHEARFPAKDVTVAVGQAHTLGLDEKARELQQDSSHAARFGSESADGQKLELVVNHEVADTTWLQGICSEKEALDYWGKSALGLLSSPVVACTVDHLVSAVTLLRGGDAKLFLRQASSDLLLDEIDAYSAEDLQTIGKLAFVAGMYGRHVVVMSATMSPAIQTGLFEAWHAGLRLHCQLKDRPLQFGVVYAANSCAPVVLETPSNPQARKSWDTFTSSVCRAYAAAAAVGTRRRLEVYPLTARSSASAFDEIERAATALHQVHHTIDPLTSKRVSVGFVRLNTAKMAWRLAEHLAKSPHAGIDIRFVSYHSKYPRNYLGVIDATLQQLCSRKDPIAFLDTPSLRQTLSSSASQDVLVLVCTTTLMETGRDFDFDWAILEPRSVRGEVQAVGRVRRHRKEALEVEAPNVFLLATPLRGLDDPKSPVWGRPGIEDNSGIRVTVDVPSVIKTWQAVAEGGGAATPTRRRVSTAGPLTQAKDVLPLTQWDAAFDAQACLRTPLDYSINRIGYLEHAVQAIHLSSSTAWNPAAGLPASLGWYLGTLGPWNAAHANSVPFRGRREPQALFVPRDAHVEFFDEVTGEYVRCLMAQQSRVPVTRALIADLPEQATRLAVDDKHILGAALRIEAGNASYKELTWDPLLGFRE